MMRTARAAPPAMLPPGRSASMTSKGSLDSNGNRKNRKIKTTSSGSKMKLSKFFNLSSSSKLGDIEDQSQATDNNTINTSNSKASRSSKSYVPGGSVRSRSDGSKRNSLLGKQPSFNGSMMSLMSDMSGSTMSNSSRRSSTRSSTSSSGRSSKKRNQVISQFVSGSSKSQVKGLWGDSGSGEATDIMDTTSEESNGSNSPTYEHKTLVDNSQNDVNDNSHTALNSSFASYGEDYSPQQAIMTEMPPLPLPPIKKGVRFAEPLVAMCVEVESSWMIWGCGKQMAQWTQEYKDQQLREKGRAKATLMDGSHLHIGREAMNAYNPKELLESQPVAPKFLSTSELKAVRHQKERLCKYRRKLKKKLRARRQQRCELQKKLAELAIVKYQERHTRIINRYKMAAPNAVEHRRRRQIKFALAAQAKTVWLVQQRQRHLLAIRRTADARLQRIRDQQSRMNIGLPHYHIRHQMKRIMVHQASMKALMRLQKNALEVQEVEGLPVTFSIDQPGVPPSLLTAQEEDDYDSDSDDDDDLDVDDINFRRLEVAIVSFLASAKSKRFSTRQEVHAAVTALAAQEDEDDDEDEGSALSGTSVEI